MRINYVRAALLAAPLLWLLVVSLPEVLRDSIFPFDSALIAANGALFERLFSEFGSFIRAPVDWLWSYYDQYPALSVRRHPPLFGFVAGIVYSVVGSSTIAAKLTVMLFGLGFATGVFFVARRMFGGDLPAVAATLLVVSTPQIALHFRSVWLDVPSLAFAIWAIYFYLARLDGDESIRNVLYIVVFTVLSLYTYQPVVVLLAGVFAHLLLREWRTIYKDRGMWVGTGVLILLMLPLIAFTVYFATDNLEATKGVIPDEWKEFDSPNYSQLMVTDKLSFAYWLDYADMIAVTFPVQTAGLILWAILRFFRKPTAAENLMFVCAVVTYVGFSWLIVKGPRYTLHMMLAPSLLTVAALRDLLIVRFPQVKRHAVYAAAVVTVAAILQSVLVQPYLAYRKLSGMDVPVAAILSEDPGATILYSGRNDAAFVFYVRNLDEKRSATVHRASVQLADPADVEDYVKRENIDFIVLEKDNPGYGPLEIIDQFRDAILAYVDSSTNYPLWSDYRLPYGVAEAEEGSVLVNVYKRSP